MSKTDRQQEQVKKVSGGGHLGGTHFGQQPSDAKEKSQDQGKGDKARPNDGRS